MNFVHNMATLKKTTFSNYPFLSQLSNFVYLVAAPVNIYSFYKQ